MSDGVRYPAGHVLLRNLQRELPVIARGDGVYLYDRTGKRYFDASSGAYVASVGHGNREVADAIAEQLGRVAYVNGTQFTSEPTEALATRLAAYAQREIPDAKLSRASFLCSGSEVVEAAVKFVRQLWVERKQPERRKMVARMPSYHGNTLYALSMGGRAYAKKLFGPLLSEILTVPAPVRRLSELADFERDGAEHYAKQLEELIAREGASTIAGFIAEPVIGSSAGAAVPPRGYFARIREVCDRHGILIIADEVLCGVGRCGDFFASKPTGCTPDVLVLGKGIGAGYAPLSVLMAREDHVAEMARGSGNFSHAQTYMMAPSITAAGIAVLDYFERHDVLANAKTVGAQLQTKLQERLMQLPFVGHVQGLGLLAGVELVADKATNAPFARERLVTERLVA
ncbi:MAG TPA: aminotransferase class III-fold pyridoxal phosphate-dependent enzyme, partial [Polyangia bacterium]|nr:aminotransferase class III-fold pyridoxal phosphate-dependent enzyme [Polyangia bacterium]